MNLCTFVTGVKRLGREVGRSSLNTAEVENEWSYNSTSPVLFVALKEGERIFRFAFTRPSGILG